MQEQNSTGVYQLDNGKWSYRFTILINGKKVSRRRVKNENGKPFTTEKAAKREREKAIRELQREAAIPDIVREKVIERKKISEVYKVPQHINIILLCQKRVF